jgi:N-acetylneuraminic acid mutarotase
LNNKGYVGAGYDGNDLKDWWQYDPATGQWTQKVSVGGSKRSNAFAFAINDKGYVGGGINNGLYVTDFWLYDPINDTWTEKNPLDDPNDTNYKYALQRTYASTFVINGKGYLSTGTYSSALNTTWEYDTVTDLWTQMTNFEGTARDAAVGFSVGTKGYVATGRNSSIRFDDIWEFDPLLEYVK